MVHLFSKDLQLGEQREIALCNRFCHGSCALCYKIILIEYSSKHTITSRRNSFVYTLITLFYTFIKSIQLSVRLALLNLQLFNSYIVKRPQFIYFDNNI